MLSLNTSNPALTRDDVFQESYGHMLAEKSKVTTLQGVVNKTALLIVIAMIGGAAGYALVQTFPAALWIGWIAGLVVSLGIFFIIRGKPHLSPILAPIYGIVEGFFLGALTASLDKMLADMGYAVAGGVALQAFIITMGIAVAMLILYTARVIRPTKRFVAVISTLTLGIAITYVLSFVLSFFFNITLPFVSMGSAFAGGTAGWIGLGVNVLILGVASMWLIIDFGAVEEKVNAGAPKHMEWYLGFSLLVTLAWIYFESVKLVVRLAIMFGGRD